MKNAPALLGFGMTLFILGATANASSLKIQLTPTGVNATEAAAYLAAVMGDPSLREKFSRGRFRVIESRFGADALAGDGKDRVDAAFPFRLEIYDYDHDRQLSVQGELAREAGWRVLDSQRRIEPTPEELDEARAIVTSDPDFEARMPGANLEAALPALVDDPARPNERIVALQYVPGLGSREKPEIVGVSLGRKAVLRYSTGAPPSACAGRSSCGFLGARQPVVASGAAGQADLEVSRDGVSLWKMRVLRPSSSSGTFGSGIDLRDIVYKGRRVLAQLHLPIMNVKYDGYKCGPFRTWGNSEGAYESAGTVSTSGIQRARAEPRTILDSGKDRGDFYGVSVYDVGSEAVLVTELEAGWFRYKVEYRFDADGTIRPRWGVTSVRGTCGCFAQDHHAYWRMDFDLGDSPRNFLQSRDATRWKDVNAEEKQYRDGAHRGWRVWDQDRKFGYEILPGQQDSTSAGDRFGRGDVWALRYHPAEVDDGTAYTGAPANLSEFIGGEPLSGEDLVVWYGASYRRANPDDAAYLVGPTLRPVSAP